MQHGPRLRTLLFVVLLTLAITPAAVLLLSFLPGIIHAYGEAAEQNSLAQAQAQARELTQRLERRRETVRNIAMLPAPLEMLRAVEGQGGGLYLNVQQAAERFSGVIRRWFRPVGDLRALAILDTKGAEQLRLEALSGSVVSVPPALTASHDLGARFESILKGDPREPQSLVLPDALQLRVTAPIKALDGAGVGVLLMDFDLRDILKGYRGSIWVDGRGRHLHRDHRDAPDLDLGDRRDPMIRRGADGRDVAWVPLSLGREAEDVLWIGTPVDRSGLEYRLLVMAGVAIAVFTLLAVALGFAVNHLVARLDHAKQHLVDGLHRIVHGERGVLFSWRGPAEMRELGAELTQLGEAYSSALQALELSRFSIEHAGESIFWLTPEGRVFFVNDAACTLLGFDRQELVGMPVSALNPVHHEESWQAHWQHLVTVGSTMFEAELRRKDGTVLPVEIAANHLVFEHQEFDLAFVRDVTERKAAAARLQSTIDELTRSNVELERFAYVAAHDLQEPVRTVVSFAQLVERRVGDRLDGEDRENLDFLVSGAKRMQAVVLDLLAYSRVKYRDAPLGRIGLADALAGAVGNLQSLINERGARIVIQPLPVVVGDTIQLVEVFQNLIANAIKFVRTGVPPEVRIAAERSDDHWVVSVCDNGIGIESEYAEQVFGIFTRLHGSRYPGTGIGLAVCKRIIERHGGRIWVRSTPGQGSCFLFTLKDGG